jgi:hypothetical protein
MTDRSRRSAATAAALIFLLAAACARKPKEPITAAPTVANARTIEALGISFAPPQGWLAIDQTVLAGTRASVAGKKQLGCFDADIAVAFTGPKNEQFIVSRLEPNADYQRGQSPLSQLGRHAAIVKSYFAATGRVMLDKIEMNGFTVFRITGKDAAEYFSKYCFVDPSDASAPCFSVDVIEPVEAYSEATNQEIGGSVRSFRRE